MSLLDQIKIGSEIEIKPEPKINIISQSEPEISILSQSESNGHYNFELTKKQAKRLSNLSINEGRRLIAHWFEIEDNMAITGTIVSAAIALERALGDMGLMVDYNLTFSVER